MTTYPLNRHGDWTATQAAPQRTQSPQDSTAAAYFAPTQARPTYSPTHVAAPTPQLAWSAEEPDFSSAPVGYSATPVWYKRPGVLALAAAALVAAASAGLFGELHNSSSGTQMNLTGHSASAAVPTSASAPMPVSGSTMPTHQSFSHSTMSNGSHSSSAGHQPMPQMSQPPMDSQAPMVPQSQSGDDHDNGASSNSSQSSHDNGGSSMHRGEKGYHWSDHQHRWVRDDSDDSSRSSSDHDNSGSSNDHRPDGYSTDSSQNTDSK